MRATPELRNSDVLAAQQGDAAAFSRLVDATSRLISSMMVAKLRDVNGSEDLTQDIYLAAWQSLHRLRNPRSFLPWLKQLARNHVHGEIRHRQRARAAVVSAGDDAIDSAVDNQPTPGESLLADEERRILRDCFEKLSDDSREIITLYYREGKSISQVAALLEVKEATVRKRLERARNSLRESSLRRFGELIQKTAPGAAFTSTVVASMALVPTEASAGTAAGSVVPVTKAGHVSLGAAFAGLALGLFGVLLYFHGYGRLAIPRSGPQIRTLARWSCATVLLVCAGIAGGAWLSSPALLIAAWTVGALVHCWVYFVQLPRLRRPETPIVSRVVQYGVPALGLVAGTITVVYAVSLM